MVRVYYLLMLSFSVLFYSCETKTDQKVSKASFINYDSSSEVRYSVWMAESDMMRNPDPRLLDFREKPKWEYTNGLICSALLKVYGETGDQKFLDYTKYYYDSMITDNGSVLTYKQTDYNIDRVNPGKALMELYKIDPKPEYLLVLDQLRDQMREHPRTSEGGFWHKKRYPWQMWLDGLYMGSPFLAQYGLEYNDPQLFDEVAKQVSLIEKYNFDSKTGLYYHGWDESREQQWADPNTGVSPNFWGRAMGWYAMALVDILDYMPEDHAQRQVILDAILTMAKGIEKYQDKDSGLWWQVLDKGAEEGNYLEASCSSMFSYFLLKSLKYGYLPTEYQEISDRAYEGIIRDFIQKNEDGSISLTNVCAVAGLGGNPYRDGTYEYYVNEEKRDNDPKGVGPFIMASLLYEETQSSK